LISIELIQEITKQYPLKIGGTHGVTHWARVLENGRRISKATGANLEIVELFAVFHDANRRREGHDHAHGKRGADLAKELRGKYFDLNDLDFALLITACEEHTSRKTSGEISVVTCWDSDRLDLPRVGIAVRPERLCTDAARDREMIAWADERGRARHLPALVYDEWGVELGD